MNTGEAIKAIRERHGLTQQDMAERVNVTRQAVSRWENGETEPDKETLKAISREFSVSINTLLGQPRKLICQCCGMPMEDDSLLSKEKDGSLNEDYCRWCYSEGDFAYRSMEDLVSFLIKAMPNPDGMSDEERRRSYSMHLSTLSHWKKD